MKQPLFIVLLSLAGLASVPALAEHEQHRHGPVDVAAAPAAATATEKAPAQNQAMADLATKDALDADDPKEAANGMDDMKSGGKSCKKCKKGMGGGGQVWDGAGGHQHGDDDAGKGGKGGMGMMGKKGMGGKFDTEALEAHVRQLEKRIDLIQSMLEMMVERRGGAGEASHH